MPVDADGNVVDLITSADSIPGRMNIGKLSEPYFNAAARDVKREILEKSGLGRHTKRVSLETFQDMRKDDREYLISEYLTFMDIVSPVMSEEYRHNLTKAEQEEWIMSYLNDPPYIQRFIQAPIPHINPDGETCTFSDEQSEAIEKRWKLTWGPVTYKTRNGVYETTIEKIRVMPIYIEPLDKLGDQWLAVDVGKLNVFGLQAPRNKGDKNAHPFKFTAPRTIGETESALMTLYGGREFIAEMLDRNGSLRTQLHIARGIYAAQYPTRIENLVDRQVIDYGEFRSLQIVRHLTEVVGIGIEYEAEEY